MTSDAERVPDPVPPIEPNRAAFDTHVVPEIEVMFRVARSLTRNDADAEDLVQDTLIRAYRAVGQFDGRHPRAWLLTIMRNTHINRNRRRRPELFQDADAGARQLERLVADDRTDASVELGFDAEIEFALADLDDRFREVVELVDVEGLSYAETAERLGVPAGTVMSRLHRARGRIRDRLDHTGLAPRSR